MTTSAEVISRLCVDLGPWNLCRPCLLASNGDPDGGSSASSSSSSSNFSFFFFSFLSPATCQQHHHQQQLLENKGEESRGKLRPKVKRLETPI